MNSILETERLRLEPFAERHLTERYIGWLNDPVTVRHSEQRHRRHDQESCRAYVALVSTPPNRLWAIMRRSDDRHIGNIAAYVNEANCIAELSILIGEWDARGRGFGAEAWRCVMEHLLQACGLRRVEAGAMAENSAMLAVFRATGMREEGRLRGHFLLEGRPVDMVLASRDKGQ